MNGIKENKKKMVECIDNNENRYSLIIGKSYELLDEDAYFYTVKAENGIKYGFYKKRFRVIEEKNTVTVDTCKVHPYTYKTEWKMDNGKTLITINNDDGFSFKVVQNNNVIVVILDDGCKGIAKCLPEDKFDFYKGYTIAYKRAMVKSMQKEIKDLCQ